MKKTVLFSIVVSLVFSICLISCSKDGAVGPAGPAGANGSVGPTGAGSIISIDTFSVPIASWVSTATNNYKYVRTNAKITKAVVDAGNVSVFVRNSAYPDWYAMPYTVAGSGGAGQRFNYNLNTLSLISENYTAGIPYVYQFKVVISQ